METVARPLASFSHLSPAGALLTLTAGILLVYLELNRPGSIVPGALGLLLVLFATASVLRFPLRPLSFVFLLSGAAVLLLELFRPLPLPGSVGAVLALTLGLATLLRHPITPAAVPCGLLLGVVSSALARIARRARRNKALDLERTAPPRARST